MDHSQFDALTTAQREAVSHVDGPLLILAGPGSGKTRVVTHRVANLLHHGISPSQILALTFTNKAADEMRSRLETMAPGKGVWVGTFHRFCSRLLRRYASMVGLTENFTIYDTADSLRAIKLVISEMDVDFTHYTPQRIAQAISWAKNDLVYSDRYVGRRGDPIGAVVEKVYPRYQKKLLASNAVDFDDLLLHAVSLLRENPELRSTLDERYRYILVDEYQDTNQAQYIIVRSLSVDYPNLAVTGDPDQSIYGWRGANLNNILDFEKDYPEVHVVRLEKNYRSTKSILRVADELISHNRRRKVKALYTDNAEGRQVRLVTFGNQRDEAEGVARRIHDEISAGRRRPSDFAVFYRTNALSRTLEDAFRAVGVPYQICNGVEFYQRKEIKDVIAYLHVINNDLDEISLLRVVNTPPRGIGATTLKRLQDFATQHSLSLLAACAQVDMCPSIKNRPAKAVKEFAELIHSLVGSATAPVEEILGRVLVQTGYRQWLMESDASEDQERLANIEELLTVAHEFDLRNSHEEAPLEAFLEHAALVNDTDNMEEGSDRVSLMTLHGSKGLEFPVAFIVACEERILPHELSMDDAHKLEEERRLLFVGITRAQEELQLSNATHRAFRGERKRYPPSSFLMEMPRGEMEIVDLDPFSIDDQSEYMDFEDWSEPVYQVDEPDADSQAAPAGGLPINLQTAADMLVGAGADEPSERTPPEAFRLGMPVIHPLYGLGKIAALSGNGRKRTATVEFGTEYGERQFRLAMCPLRPVVRPR